MIRNETFRNGQIVRAETIDLAAGIYTLEVDGYIIDGPRPLTEAERQQYGPQPLEGTPLVATLNAVLGLWSLQDAANIAQLPEQALIAEAEAWAAAGEQNGS